MTPPAPEGDLALMGDAAVLVQVLDAPAAARLARRIEAARWRGVEELVVGADSLLVAVDPDVADPLELGREALRLLASTNGAAAGAGGDEGAGTGRRRHHDLPVAFDGPDLDEVAALAGCAPAEVARRLAVAELEVAFVGFVPGFAYLSGLPPELAAVERRREPRPRVPAGAVAVGGGFAGVYPLATPGGWRLLGRTDAPLLDVASPPYALLAPGDTVRFRTVASVGEPPAPARPRLQAAGRRRAVVVEPGARTTVQDVGRRGVAAAGIPRGGAADPWSSRLANLAAGNAATAATLEVTLSGPALRFDGGAVVALVGGAMLRIDGRPMPAGAVQHVPAGAVVSVGPVTAGARAYLAVAGGFTTEPLFGSRAGDTVSGLGAGALRAGDELPIGIAGRPRGRHRGAAPTPRPAILRIVPGPAAGGCLAPLVARAWVVGQQSDRAGVRLEPREAGSPRPLTPPPVRSHGVTTGAVQVPPAGEPIVLGPDHGTLGGYPVVAGVVTADLGVLGQLRPGDGVRFAVVTPEEARAARTRSDRDLAASVGGWYPVATA